MPVKTFKCVLCGDEISRRKSLLIKIEGVEGRACRKHQEVINMINEQKKEFENQKEETMLSKANSFMKVITMTSFIRVAHTLHKIPLFILLAKARLKCNKEENKKVEEELNNRGAIMSQDEMVTSLMSWCDLKKRAKQ